MNIAVLRATITSAVFSDVQVKRLFSAESQQAIGVQLSRWSKRQLLVRIKRGLYRFPDRPIDELSLSRLLYTPSYISLETALNLYGILPDSTQQVTSVTPTTTRSFQTPYGSYSYAKIQSALFFGFSSEGSGEQQYNLAHPAKAVLDYLYLRQITNLSETRLVIQEELSIREQLLHYGTYFPKRIQRLSKELV